MSHSVLPCWEIYVTLGKFLKHLATINLPKYPTFVGNFCKDVKIYHFSSEITFGQLLLTYGNFFLVTLVTFLIMFWYEKRFANALHHGPLL